MPQCDGCHVRAILRARTTWGTFHFCNHCWQKHQRALKAESVQYLDKVFDVEKVGL